MLYRGTVVKIVRERGIAFIQQDEPGKPDMFMHMDWMKKDSPVSFDQLVEGLRVQYRVAPDRVNRPQAQDVEVISDEKDGEWRQQ